MDQSSIRNRYRIYTEERDVLKRSYNRAVSRIEALQKECTHPEVVIIDDDRGECFDCHLASDGPLCTKSPELSHEYKSPETGMVYNTCIHCGTPEGSD